MLEVIPDTKLRVESSFKNCYDEIREFFVHRNDGLCYMGLYKCISTSYIAPAGIEIPGMIVRALSCLMHVFIHNPPSSLSDALLKML